MCRQRWRRSRRCRDRPIDGRGDRRDRLRGGRPDPRRERPPRRRPSLRRRWGCPVRRGGENPLATIRRPGAEGERSGHGPCGDGPGRRRLPADHPSLPGVPPEIPLFLLPPGAAGFDPSEALEKSSPASRHRGGGVPSSGRRALPDAPPVRGPSGGIVGPPFGRRDPKETLEDAMRRSLREKLPVRAVIQREVGAVRHAYSHYRITLHAFFASRRGCVAGWRGNGWLPVDGKGRSPFHGPTGSCSKSSIGGRKMKIGDILKPGGRGVIGTASKAGWSTWRCTLFPTSSTPGRSRGG